MSTPVEQWVEKQAALTKPDKVYWVQGTEDEMRRLIDLGIREEKTGMHQTFRELNDQIFANSYLHRSHPSDVARTEQLTFVCTPTKDEAGPNNNWMEPKEAKEKVSALFDGCMRGRTLYVIPYMMGHPDSPYAKPCIQITDSIYVVVSMYIMTRMGQQTLNRIGSTDNFVKGLHSIGDLDPARRYIMHFPQEDLVMSFGSGYGGNALLGKKCFSLRIASYQGQKEGWLAEHMIIMGVEDKKTGEKMYILGSFPSACGKTNLAMIDPVLEGYNVTTLGDDIAWINVGPDGRLYAINPEAGFFGVAPGTSDKTNPQMMKTLKSGKVYPTLFTNVGLDTQTNSPWWEGLTDIPPSQMLDWQGNPWEPSSGKVAAHPNSRFTVSAYNCPTLSPEFDNPKGVPISAILFGGRRSDTAPLVCESFDWNHGVFKASSLGSETTTAASGQVGLVRRDPMAMLPFCGYNMADYFRHWINVGSRLTNPPKIFFVNWFKKNDQGKFIWPGFRDNFRVIKWMMDRVKETVPAQETPIGFLPNLTDLDLTGLTISSEILDTLFEVKREQWLKEIEGIEAFYGQFGDRLPAELTSNLAKLKKTSADRLIDKRGTMTKYVYFFGGQKAEGESGLKDLLGGKGANLAEMVNLGIPVPPGFTITTEVCTLFYDNNMQFPAGLKEEVLTNLKEVERLMNMGFGDPKNPLLLSIRSGARASMPGMMDTVLNLGLNSSTVEALANLTGNEWFAWDCYRRFVAMYGDVVLGLKPESKEEEDPFEVLIDKKKKTRGIKLDIEFTKEDLKDLVTGFKRAIKEKLNVDFPEDPIDQLWGAIGAVFKSWMNARAIAYRKLNDIPASWGTAVNVQSMVFGNIGNDSGTGVAFTRNPSTGENVFYGEYLLNAQGEDVVAGTRTPLPINKKQKTDRSTPCLEEEMPEVYSQLLEIRATLERHFRDMQDIEFTIQRKKLWMLQTRNGKRTAFAEFKAAVDMVKEGLIDKEEALMRVSPDGLNQILRPVFDPKEVRRALKEERMVVKGLNAGPGAATGKVVYNAEDAEAWASRGEKVILVRIETSPEDIRGMNAAEGILTSRGGMTSHAALVARQMGKVCVAGCGELDINYRTKTIRIKGRTINEGDYISIDGSTGEVFVGEVKTIPSEVLAVLVLKTMKAEDSQIYKDFESLMKWADETRRLGVRTNADQPDQAQVAIDFGAEGIGLCRTEHMFFEGERIDAVREMIVAEDLEGRKKALAKLLPIQKADFAGLFNVMKGRPVTIRTLDPPLHEFLPHGEKDIRDLAAKMGITYEKLQVTVAGLQEANPMLGLRGCRLGILYPEITEMQARAIFEAACDVKQSGVEVNPEIMIPLVGDVGELSLQTKVVDRVAKEVFAERGVAVDYRVGTMIEIPRAALTADEIAGPAEFFSFGTNDLTQTTFGMSRDDAGKFLRLYVEKDVLDYDPFQRVDERGVGKLMKMGVELGRKTRPNLKIGICGEHGGEPNSVKFCHRIGLNYVSCSPYRVTAARLAAAQAAIEEKRGSQN